ncbi:MAG: glycosyltransferase family 2 protein [Hyphomonadaceae bacterium]|nr:glycosyltransferase family 2 protein [Hyphomonadaceae bacterium]
MSDSRAQPNAAALDVSVIIAAWNAATSIERSVASALASANVKLEVIVVDDASPDATFEILSRIAAADSRVVTRRLPANAGPSVARNLGISLAHGRYVAVLDADDTMRSDRLAKLVSLADSSGADIVVDNMMSVDESGAPVGANPFLKAPRFVRSCNIDLETWISFNNPLADEDTLGYLKPLISRQTLLKTGLAYDPSLRNSEDYYLVAHLLAAKARMTYSPDADYVYTRSTGSTSHRLKPSQTRAWLDAEQRFVARHGANLSKGELSALARRGRTLRNVDKLIAVTDAMKTRKFGESARLMAADLRGAAYTVRMLAKVAMNKALQRKTL